MKTSSFKAMILILIPIPTLTMMMKTSRLMSSGELSQMSLSSMTTLLAEKEILLKLVMASTRSSVDGTTPSRILMMETMMRPSLFRSTPRVSRSTDSRTQLSSNTKSPRDQPSQTLVRTIPKLSSEKTILSRLTRKSTKNSADGTTHSPTLMLATMTNPYYEKGND